MAQESPNPFVLPGFGQQGEAAQNPLFAGLDMMRQAWQSLAGAGRMDAPAMPPMSLEDLDRRIRELQTVQNWLQLNATMLANTIQGMEIQRSTLKTLQSFAGAVVPDAAGAAAASTASADGASQGYAQAAGDWWNLVQQQFEQLREATTASLSSMAEATDAARATAAAGKSAGEQGPSASARAPAARKTPPKKAPATGKTSAAAKPPGAASKPARKPRAS